MDTQRKKGVLDICVLAVLARGASYGYKIVGDVSQCIEISESTLYPILKRLEGSGCVSVYAVEHNGRLRKYYSITDAGREKIASFLTEWHTVMRIYTFIEEKAGAFAESKPTVSRASSKEENDA